jgi:hypothetical protein
MDAPAVAAGRSESIALTAKATFSIGRIDPPLMEPAR